MTRRHLTRGGVASALRRLRGRALVDLADGKWQLQPPELGVWLRAVHEHGPQAAESLRWVMLQVGEWITDTNGSAEMSSKVISL